MIDGSKKRNRWLSVFFRETLNILVQLYHLDLVLIENKVSCERHNTGWQWLSSTSGPLDFLLGLPTIALVLLIPLMQCEGVLKSNVKFHKFTCCMEQVIVLEILRDKIVDREWATAAFPINIEFCTIAPSPKEQTQQIYNTFHPMKTTTSHYHFDVVNKKACISWKVSLGHEERSNTFFQSHTCMSDIPDGADGLEKAWC